jgi:pilus assembly protein CpaF
MEPISSFDPVRNSEELVLRLAADRIKQRVVSDPAQLLVVAGSLLDEVISEVGQPVAMAAQRDMLRRLIAEARMAANAVVVPTDKKVIYDASPTYSAARNARERSESLKDRILRSLFNRIDLNVVSTLSKDDLRQQITETVVDIMKEFKLRIGSQEQRDIISAVIAEMVGLGPIQTLMDDDTVSDILVNGPAQVFVERGGKLVLTEATFRDDAHVLQVARRIVNNVGRRVDELNPLVDARLDDGSRVNIVIPPLALDGPTIAIRKFARRTITFDSMLQNGSISLEMSALLKIAARCRANIIVSGGTGSGKTTMLNALSRLIDEAERIVTIEDAAELRLQQRHVVRLESRPASLEGEGEISIRQLFRNSLRMRPDRIILGEVRGEEALDLLQAMNTGHDGSMCTVHANSAREAIVRLENMIAMVGMNYPSSVVRQQIGSSVNLVVQVERMRDGVRRVVEIAEVRGLSNGEIDLRTAFTFKVEDVDSAGNIRGRFEKQEFPESLVRRCVVFGLEEALHSVYRQ